MANQNIKSTLVSVSVAAVLFGGLIWFSRSGPSTDSTGPLQADSGQENVKSANIGTLSTEELNFDFGTISMAKGKVFHAFKIRNNSDKPAMVTKVYTSCMCTEATLTHGGKTMGPFGMPGHSGVSKINDTVNPGDEISIEAVFDPVAHGPAGVGRVDRVVFVETESGLPLQLRFTATVTP